MNSFRRANAWMIFAAIAGVVGSVARPDEASPLAWRPWSPSVFVEAQRENKRVLLDLEAVWCHWCHVMDETTYRDPAVVEELRSRFILVRVDQDSRPDLASRYEDYGWPATIVFASTGTELAKRRGYIPPEEMLLLLREIGANPAAAAARPHPDVLRSPARVSADAADVRSSLTPERQTALLNRWREFYDRDKGGWGFRHKYLDWDNLELALRLASRGDAAAAEMARTTLRLQREHLLDPVWGGVYQYSVGGDWREPHFEKLLQFQAENLRTYAQAHAQFGDADDLEAADAIRHYVRTFLTGQSSTVFVSQDADLVPGVHSADYFALDDAARRRRGVPRVDDHVYARENGWYIRALCEFAAFTGDHAPVAEAAQAARWTIEHRAIQGGGFRHDNTDEGGPYLADTLAMARGFLALHQVTQQSEWLQRAEASARFIATRFRVESGGFASSDVTAATPFSPSVPFDDNVAFARFAIALAAVTGRAEYRTWAAHALRYTLADDVLDDRGPYVAGILLAEEEFRTDPLHVTVVGPRSDPAAVELFTAALRSPTSHKLVEWWDPGDPAPRGEAHYPTLKRAAAFLCANGTCSAPLVSSTALATRISRALSRP